jgi:hypothetical protein
MLRAVAVMVRGGEGGPSADVVERGCPPEHGRLFDASVDDGVLVLEQHFVPPGCRELLS